MLASAAGVCRVVFAAVGLYLAVTAAAHAVQPGERLADPGLESRARALSAELRCLVCQNQSIDDSDAPLAKDLRLLVRERLAAGDTDGQVMSFVVERYGEFVLLRPTFGLHTLLLWLAPALVLVVGIALASRTLRRSRSTSSAIAVNDERPLSADEQQRLDRLMRDV
ncbi:MAG: cytochrome c-type biogenesis protein [Hyphomicrobiaceae bacterium]|nr:cytochrome c-type biogenesis protein [Hyphomicrobiaceae bacterium]